MPNEVFKKDSSDFITNMKESVDVTFANDDDKQLKAHNKSVRYQLQNRPSGQQDLHNHSFLTPKYFFGTNNFLSYNFVLK